MTTIKRTLVFLTLLLLIAPFLMVRAQNRVFDFRQGPLSYWQHEFGPISQSAHWTMPDTRGEGIILRNVAGYGSEINMTSHPFIPNGWSGHILVENTAPNTNWCGSLKVSLYAYGGGLIKEESYSTYGGGFKDVSLYNTCCTSAKGCYLKVRLHQGYGTGNSNMNYLRSLTVTDYYGKQNLTQDASGHVAIAANTDAHYKFQVGGEIRSTGINVQATPWPDYVFEAGYDLKPLEEVQAYVEKHGHLPEIPSAEEIEEGGVDVGEMNRLLIQKLEEMTLYQIELLNR